MEKHSISYKTFRRPEPVRYEEISVEAANQQYHLILADIAMAAAIKTYDRDYKPPPASEAYRPGSIRDRWLGQTLRRRFAQTGDRHGHRGGGLARGNAAGTTRQRRCGFWHPAGP